MLYVANVEVMKGYYMEETSTEKAMEVHLVEAESESQAQDMVQEFYEKKSDPYYVTYYANIQSINPIITQESLKADPAR